MKKLLLVAAIVAFVPPFVQAANTKQYVALKTHYSSMRSTYENIEGKHKFSKRIYGGSLAYGFKFGDIRTELEGNINTAGKKTIEGGKIKTKISTDSVMLNGYYEVPTGFAMRPYVGAGIGVAHVKGVLKWSIDEIEESGKFKMSNNEMAYQLASGLSYELTQNLAIDAEYRYTKFGTFSKTDEYGKSTLSVKTHNCYLGLRYMF